MYGGKYSEETRINRRLGWNVMVPSVSAGPTIGVQSTNLDPQPQHASYVTFASQNCRVRT